MSTRATYKFESHTGAHTFYGHHDGYPQGAAFRLWLMHHTRCRGGYGDAFFRGNPDVELTRSHELHGDTEYRYTINKDGILSATERIPGQEWKPFYVGHYAEFVNNYLPADWCGTEDAPARERLQEVTTEYGRREWKTRSQLTAEVERLTAEVERGLKQYTRSLERAREAVAEYDAAHLFETA
jgi:hypothetical protein